MGWNVLTPHDGSTCSPLTLGLGALTQLGAAVIVDYPREHRVLREVIAAAVRQVVEVQEVLVVGEVPALPLQRVALGRALCHVVL